MARAWLRAPPFLWTLSTEAKTPTPAARARSGVESVQLSATTMIRSGGSTCSCSEVMVAEIRSSSLCAGMRTVMVTGPWKTPRVSAMTILGARGMPFSSWERRYRLATVFSTEVAIATKIRATTSAATITASGGAYVS